MSGHSIDRKSLRRFLNSDHAVANLVDGYNTGWTRVAYWWNELFPDKAFSTPNLLDYLVAEQGYTVRQARKLKDDTIVEILLGAVRARETASKPSATNKKRRRRTRPSVTALPLTTKQVEAVHIVAECKGSFAEAARRLAVDPSTVRQHYYAAQKKLGKKAVKHATQPLPADRRGQANLSEGDDRRR